MHCIVVRSVHHTNKGSWAIRIAGICTPIWMPPCWPAALILIFLGSVGLPTCATNLSSRSPAHFSASCPVPCRFDLQSNTFSAQECSSRIDAYVSRLATAVPEKCVLAPPPADAAATADGAASTTAADAEGDSGEAEAADEEDGLTEFERGVVELAKAKLERPKRLGELSARWWSEVSGGGLRFDRRVSTGTFLLLYAASLGVCVPLWRLEQGNAYMCGCTCACG